MNPSIASKIIDLRSDTVTKPSVEMMECIRSAEVGDDSYGEDPTVNELQHLISKITGKDAAIFVPSGTLANQIAIHLFSKRGDTVLLNKDAHIIKNEFQSTQIVSGVNLVELGTSFLSNRDIHDYMNTHAASTEKISLMALENTHTSHGGAVFPYDQLVNACIAAKSYGIKCHLDGARLFNAVIATKIETTEWTKHFDTVSICISKGLGAPVGSLLCGTSEVIEQAKAIRKALGGSMRQSGIVAAAGIYALKNNVNRLAVDHENAKSFANGLVKLGIKVLNEVPDTNIIIFQISEVERFISETKSKNLLLRHLGSNKFRAVIHKDISANDIETALEIIKDLHLRGHNTNV